MWIHLRNVNQQRNLAREFEVEHIFEYTQEDKNVRSFYAVLQLLWSEQNQVLGEISLCQGLKKCWERTKGQGWQVLDETLA